MKTIRISVRFLVILALVLLAGCASDPAKQSSNFAFKQPEEAFSMPHPVEFERKGVEYVTVFPAIADAGMWGTENVGGYGFWPLLAEQKDVPLRGYVFLSDINLWGDFILQGVVAGRLSQLSNSKFLILNRDGGFIHGLQGREGQQYVPKKFEKEKQYQNGMFQKFGTTLSEQSDFWRQYFADRGMEVPEGFAFAVEIRVGSPEWEEFKQDLAERFAKNYKMPNGEIRLGKMDLEEFRQEASKNYGLTKGQRFFRKMEIPIATDLMSLGAGLAGMILNGVIAANTDTWEGFYARAEGLRKDLMPSFRRMQEMYKQLLVQRDAVIYELQSNNEGGRKK